jgi:hypothetical protein
VKSIRRAGRAPYNFVPLGPGKWQEVDRPPRADSYLDASGEELLSGEIVLELTALTDFYTRGMWSLRDSANKSNRDHQPAPFQAGGKLCLPGSSLRGMFRNLVEILGNCPLHPVNDQQHFFRAVGSTDNPKEGSSFEPQAVTYRRQLGVAASKVQAGYLYGATHSKQLEWYIKPALVDPVYNTQRFRYRTTDEWLRKPIHFHPGEVWADVVPGPGGGAKPGTLVCSGRIPPPRRRDNQPPRKDRAQWVIHSEDPAGTPVPIPDYDVEAYRDAGISQAIRKSPRGGSFEYDDKSKGVACFYVEWHDHIGRRHVSFGHTPFFRLPYLTTTTGAVPSDWARIDPKPWDRAQALFGRLPEAETDKSKMPDGRRSRVTFEDGILLSAPAEPFQPRPSPVVLGAPKPTTYQHYLVQPSEKVEDAMHWDGDRLGSTRLGPVVRGHKRYWHRKGAAIPPVAPDQERNVATYWQPARNGARFTATVHYESLSEAELGLLLSAIQLPPGCAHKFGMGKALGLGSFQVEVKALRSFSRAQRYAAFLDAGALVTGATHAPDPADEATRLRERYCRSLEQSLNEFWATPRMKELHALLQIEGLPPNWLNRTRSLQFDKVDGRSYNEYLQVGYPDRPELQKRRPLPPASQVVSGDPAVPDDPLPPFDPPNQRRR